MHARVCFPSLLFLVVSLDAVKCRRLWAGSVGCLNATAVLAWEWTDYWACAILACPISSWLSLFVIFPLLFFSTPSLYVIDKSAVLRDRTGNVEEWRNLDSLHHLPVSWQIQCEELRILKLWGRRTCLSSLAVYHLTCRVILRVNQV